MLISGSYTAPRGSSYDHLKRATVSRLSMRWLRMCERERLLATVYVTALGVHVASCTPRGLRACSLSFAAYDSGCCALKVLGSPLVHSRRLELPDSTTQCYCPHHRSLHAPLSAISSKSTAHEYLSFSCRLRNGDGVADRGPAGRDHRLLPEGLDEGPALVQLVCGGGFGSRRSSNSSGAPEGPSGGPPQRITMFVVSSCQATS